ncbi:hypothetical protein ABFA07_016673 [Porites harrisoni]
MATNETGPQPESVIPLQVTGQIVTSSEGHQNATTSFPLQSATSLTHSGNAAPLDAAYAPTRKRFKASRDEEEILRRDQQANEAMARAYERATQFNTTLKAIINWHEKHQ